MHVKKWINSLWNQHQNIDEYINDQINAEYELEIGAGISLIILVHI